MKGVVTKKHFFMVVKSFGWSKAFRLLLSRKPVALLALIS